MMVEDEFQDYPIYLGYLGIITIHELGNPINQQVQSATTEGFDCWTWIANPAVSRDPRDP